MKINANFLRGLSKEKYLSYIHSLPNFHEEKIQTYLTVILTLITICFFGVFAIAPTLSTIFELRKSLADSIYVDSQLGTKINNMTTLQESFFSVSKQLPLLDAAIPTTPSTSEIAGKVRALATKSNVTLFQLEIESTDIAMNGKPPSILQPIVVNIGAHGSEAALQNFYESVTNFDRILTIKYLTITAPVDKNKAVYALSIQAYAYYRP